MTPLETLNATGAETVGIVPARGLSAVDAPATHARPSSYGCAQLKSVEPHMGALTRHQLQVLGAVVQPVAVDMMDAFFGGQRPPECLLHYDTVFLNIPVRCLDEAVSFLDIGTSLPARVSGAAKHDAITASVRAEIAGSDQAWAAAD